MPPAPPLPGRHKQHVRGITVTFVFGLLLAVVVVAVLASVFLLRNESQFSGNLEAFCALIDQDNNNIPDNELNYKDMAEVAPEEIRRSVQKLADRSTEISTLENSDDLAAYFAAVFDRAAVQAQRNLDSYAFGECEVAVPQSTLRREIRNYINQNHNYPVWGISADLDLSMHNGVLQALSVDLGEATSEQALRACEAYNEYLANRLVPGVLTVHYHQGHISTAVVAATREPEPVAGQDQVSPCQ